MFNDSKINRIFLTFFRGAFELGFKGWLMLFFFMATVPAKECVLCKKIVSQIDQKVALAQGVAMGALKKIKAIENYYNDSNLSETAKQLQAGKDMVLVLEMAKIFDETEVACTKLFKQFDTTATEEQKDLIASVNASKGKLAKYRIYVDKYVKEALNKYGKPTGDGFAQEVVTGTKPVVFTGSAGFGTGGSAHKQPNGSTIQIDRTAYDYTLDVATNLATTANTNINVDFNQRQTTEQKVGRVTNVGIGASQVFTPAAKLMANVRYSKYTDKSDLPTKERDFGTFDVNSGFYFRKPFWHVDVYGGFQNNNFADENAQDYTSNNASVGAESRLLHKDGHLLLSADLLSKKFSNDGWKYYNRRDFRSQLQYIIPNGKMEISTRFRRFYFPNEGDAALRAAAFIKPTQLNDKENESQIKNQIMFHASTGTAHIVTGPKLNIYYFPDDSVNNDYGYYFESQSRKMSFVSVTWNTFFRDMTNYYDHFHSRLDVLRNPFGSGFYARWNTFARIYTRQTNRVTGHIAESYLDLGGTYAGKAVLKKLNIGPILGSRFVFGPEVNGVKKDNTDNNLRAGAFTRLVWAIPPAITWSMEGRYVNTMKYKEQPHQNYRSVDVRSSLSYPINASWLVDADFMLHHSGQNGVPRDLDMEKLRIGVFVKYLLNSK